MTFPQQKLSSGEMGPLTTCEGVKLLTASLRHSRPRGGRRLLMGRLVETRWL